MKRARNMIKSREYLLYMRQVYWNKNEMNHSEIEMNGVKILIPGTNRESA